MGLKIFKLIGVLKYVQVPCVSLCYYRKFSPLRLQVKTGVASPTVVAAMLLNRTETGSKFL